jgi:hypothetical protein
MEELVPQELEDLVQELEEASAQESLPQEVEDLLRVLQSGDLHAVRQDAAEQLGNVGTSSPRIVRALIAASESDPHPNVRRAATGSLRAPVHKEYLRQHPDVVESTVNALQQGPGKGETRRGLGGGQGISLIRCLVISPIAGLAVGLALGLWDADQSLFHDAGLTCGTGFLVALAVGAVVGAVVGVVAGGAEQERSHLVPFQGDSDITG